MRVKCRIARMVFKGDNYGVYGCTLDEKNDNIVLHPTYHNFSIKSEMNLTEGKVYELDVEETNYKGQTSYNVIGYPSLENVDVKNLTFENAMEIMCEFTTETQANNLLSVYPNFIAMVLENETDQIDVNKLFNIKDFRLNLYINEIKEKYKFYHIMQSNKVYELSITECKELDKRYKTIDEVQKQLDEHPYRNLIEICNRGFESVDRCVMANFQQFQQSDERAEYLMLFILKKNEYDGHTKINANEMARYCNELSPELTKKLKDVAIESGQIYYDNDSKDIAIMGTYLAECYIAGRIKDNINNADSLGIDWKKYQKTDDYDLTDEQAEILRIANEYKIGMLMGNSGSGKSHSIRGLITMLEDNGLSYTIVAPTGVASKVCAKSTGRKASTIHKAIGGDKRIYTSFLIVDEFSMVSVELFNALLQRTEPYVRILVIGDDSQLPSIGCGNCMRNMIDSGIVPMAKLTKIFRYGESTIATIATDIRNGKQYIGFDGEYLFEHKGKVNDYKFVMIGENPREQVIAEYNKLLKKYTRDEIMILSPFNVGDFGTYIINSEIQNDSNPLKKGQEQASIKKGNTTINFRVGDKVINTVNTYDALTVEKYEKEEKMKQYLKLDCDMDIDEQPKEREKVVDIVNGDIGYIRDIDKKGNVFVQIDEDIIVFTKQTINNLLGADSISTHKSQGSQAKAVINIMHKNHKKMLNRSLIYVADTRCQEMLVEIADPEVIKDALDIVVTDDRETFLTSLLLK